MTEIPARKKAMTEEQHTAQNSGERLNRRSMMRLRRHFALPFLVFVGLREALAFHGSANLLSRLCPRNARVKNHGRTNNNIAVFHSISTRSPSITSSETTTSTAEGKMDEIVPGNSLTNDPIDWIACYVADTISSLEMFQDHDASKRNQSVETSYSGDLIGYVDSEVFAAQIKTLVRVGLPAILLAALGKVSYPTIAMLLVGLENDDGVLAVLSQDASQYVQNILTTSGLLFSILVGYTYYFQYQQQERVSFSHATQRLSYMLYCFPFGCVTNFLVCFFFSSFLQGFLCPLSGSLGGKVSFGTGFSRLRRSIHVS